MPKTLLKRKEVSRNHFSSRSKKLDSGQNLTRCVVRVLEAYDLLASDAETGKSDPVCFICCGHKDVQPDWDLLLPDADDGLYILRTNVVNCTLEPHWDSEHIFPLDVSDIEGLLDGKITINVRDEDIDSNNNRSYDDLGFAEILFSDILARGKKLNETAIFDIARWYKLQKCPGMRKVDGHIKISVTFFFQEDAMELFTAVGASTPSGFINQLQSKLNSNNNQNIKPLPPQSKERSSSKNEGFTVAAPRISLKSSTSNSQPLSLATGHQNQDTTRVIPRPMTSEMIHSPSSKADLLGDYILKDLDIITERVDLPKHHLAGTPLPVSNIMPPKSTATSKSNSNSMNTLHQIDNATAAANPLLSSETLAPAVSLQEKFSESSVIVSNDSTGKVPLNDELLTRKEGEENVEKLLPPSVLAPLPLTDNSDTNSSNTHPSTTDININEVSEPTPTLSIIDEAVVTTGGDMALPSEVDVEDDDNIVESLPTNNIKQDDNTNINNTSLAPSSNETNKPKEGVVDHQLHQPPVIIVAVSSDDDNGGFPQIKLQAQALINQSKLLSDSEYIENNLITNTTTAPGPRKVKLKSSKSSLPDYAGGDTTSNNNNPTIKEDSNARFIDTSSNNNNGNSSKDHNAIRVPIITIKPEDTNTMRSSNAGITSASASASASRGRPKSATARSSAAASRSRSNERNNTTNSNNINSNSNSVTGKESNSGLPVTKATSKAPSSLSSRYRTNVSNNNSNSGISNMTGGGSGSGSSSAGAKARIGDGLVLEKPWHKKRSRQNSIDYNTDIRIVTAASSEDADIAAGGADMLYLDGAGGGDQAFNDDDDEEQDVDAVEVDARPSSKNRATGHVTETVRSLRKDTKGGVRGGTEEAPIRLQQENEILRVSLEELVRATKDGLKELSQRLATVELNIVQSPSSPLPPPSAKSRNRYSLSDQEQDTEYHTRLTRPRSAGVTGRNNRYRKQPFQSSKNNYQQQQQQQQQSQQQQQFRSSINWVQVDQWLQQDEPHLAFGAVLDRGGTSDLAKLMLIFGSRPQELSANLRNQVFDGIATLLIQSKQLDVCLSWTLHLVRHRLVQELVRHTQRSLAEGLMHAATEDSKRGVLAARLEAEITKAMEM